LASAHARKVSTDTAKLVEAIQVRRQQCVMLLLLVSSSSSSFDAVMDAFDTSVSVACGG
jgi:hypothetical protein